jgi:hypothetical protein
MQENFDEENELLEVENYSLPEKKEVVLDLSKGEISDVKDLSPLEMIALTAKEKGMTLKEFDPKAPYLDTGCRKPGCWGRGYKGWDGIVPIPCTCIFAEKMDNSSPFVSNNRKNVRSFIKSIQKDSLVNRENQAKNMQLVNTGNNLWKSKNGHVFTWAKNKENKWGFYKLTKIAAEKGISE